MLLVCMRLQDLRHSGLSHKSACTHPSYSLHFSRICGYTSAQDKTSKCIEQSNTSCKGDLLRPT